MNIAQALKKAFESGGPTALINLNGEDIIIHREMNPDEVLEIIQTNIQYPPIVLDLIEQSIDQIINSDIGNGEPQNTEVFSTIKEEIEYEYNLYKERTK